MLFYCQGKMECGVKLSLIGKIIEYCRIYYRIFIVILKRKYVA